MKIEKGGRLKTNIYNKRDVLTFPIVNFPFTSSNISASRAHGLYISQIMLFWSLWPVRWFSGQSSAADA